MPREVFSDPSFGAYEVLEKRQLSAADTQRLQAALAAMMSAPKPEIVSMCFTPAHGITLRMRNGAEYHVAVCVHCNKVAYNLGSDGTAMKSMGSSALSRLVVELMPMPAEFQRRYFPH